mgnify:CR=1 FL=1
MKISGLHNAAFSDELAVSYPQVFSITCEGDSNTNISR